MRLVFIAYPRIKIPVGDIDEQVGESYHEGDHDNAALDDEEVLVEDGPYHKPAYAGDVEYGLHQDRTADEVPELDTQEGHYRDNGVFQGMSCDNRSLFQALGTGCSYIVLTDDFEHAGACLTGK